MKRLTGLFVLGLATVLPAGLLLYGVGRLLMASEHLLGQWLARWLPDGAYLPGMGLAATVGLVLLAGLLAQSWIGPPVGSWFRARISGIPVVGRAYLTLRDVTGRFSKKQPIGYKSVVLVSDPQGGSRLGLVAEQEPLDCGQSGQALVPVYFPAPFQPGGSLEFLPQERLAPTDMTVDEAFTLILSGGLARAPKIRPDGMVD